LCIVHGPVDEPSKEELAIGLLADKGTAAACPDPRL
jgi:hypothetical protein